MTAAQMVQHWPNPGGAVFGSFIRDHSPALAYQTEIESLIVVTQVVGASGVVGGIVETIPCTRQAVLDWLGY